VTAKSLRILQNVDNLGEHFGIVDVGIGGVR